MNKKQVEDMDKGVLRRRAQRILGEHRLPLTRVFSPPSGAPIRQEARERLPRPLRSVSPTFFRGMGPASGVHRFFDRYVEYERYNPETITDTLIAGGIPFLDRKTLLGSVLLVAGAMTILDIWPPFWHSVGGSVYHFMPQCTKGSSIGPRNLRGGTNGRPPCKECAKYWKQAFYYIPDKLRDEVSAEEWADAKAWSESGIRSDV